MDVLIFILVISPFLYAITISIISTEQERKKKQ
jgi:hypothetical protein